VLKLCHPPDSFGFDSLDMQKFVQYEQIASHFGKVGGLEAAANWYNSHVLPRAQWHT
jgi:hypothetical protein